MESDKRITYRTLRTIASLPVYTAIVVTLTLLVDIFGHYLWGK